MKQPCESCNNNKSIAVVNALGPVSTAFCHRCLVDGIYPWWNIVGYLGMAGSGELHPAYEELLQINLKFHGKTREEFEAEVQEIMEDYRKYEEERQLTSSPQ